MQARHNFRTYYYGNFSESPESAKKTPEPRAWYAFSPQPRVGYNYFGFRNRLSILTEAYSYLDFRRRVEVTEAWVEEILRYSVVHGDEIRRLTHRVDEETIKEASQVSFRQIGVEYRSKALPKPVEILVGKVTKIRNPNSGQMMTAMLEDQVTPVKMLDFGLFEATRTVPTAVAYLFRREKGMHVVLDKLLAHGITVEELTAPAALEVTVFRIEDVTKKQKLFEGHHEITLRGNYEDEKQEFPQGTLLVRSAQPLGVLAAYMLEPESEDGLVTWNFLDSFLEKGKVYPIYKLKQNVNLAARVIERSK
jgi:dipeptidyl-peptidase-4